MSLYEPTVYNPNENPTVLTRGSYNEDKDLQAGIYTRLGMAATETRAYLQSIEGVEQHTSGTTEEPADAHSPIDTAVLGNVGEAARAYWQTAAGAIQNRPLLAGMAAIMAIGAIALYMRGS